MKKENDLPGTFARQRLLTMAIQELRQVRSVLQLRVVNETLLAALCCRGIAAGLRARCDAKKTAPPAWQEGRSITCNFTSDAAALRPHERASVSHHVEIRRVDV
jgi:hypothetical protein